MIERKFGLGVVICIFNRNSSKILLLKRNEEKRKRNNADWGNVGGKVELGEKLIDACIREAKEEIGIELNPVKLRLIEIKETPFLTEIHHALHFVYATIIEEKERIILNDESEEYKWFDLDNLPDKMFDKKEDIIKIVNKEKEKKFNKLIPELIVNNVEKSINFYKDILKFKLDYERKEDKFAFLSFQGSQLMIQEKNKTWETGKLEYPFGRGINFQIETKNIDLLIKLLEKNNYPFFQEIRENTYKVKEESFRCKEFLVQDPDGYLLRFSEIL